MSAFTYSIYHNHYACRVCFVLVWCLQLSVESTDWDLLCTVWKCVFSKSVHYITHYKFCSFLQPDCIIYKGEIMCVHKTLPNRYFSINYFFLFILPDIHIKTIAVTLVWVIWLQPKRIQMLFWTTKPTHTAEVKTHYIL